MSGALNKFKTVTANISTTLSTVYSCPLGYATVILMAQVSNNGPETIQISADISKTGTPTSLVNGISIPVADAITILTGRLIMNYGDSLELSASDDTSGQLVLSLLETLVG